MLPPSPPPSLSISLSLCLSFLSLSQSLARSVAYVAVNQESTVAEQNYKRIFTTPYSTAAEHEYWPQTCVVKYHKTVKTSCVVFVRVCYTCLLFYKFIICFARYQSFRYQSKCVVCLLFRWVVRSAPFELAPNGSSDAFFCYCCFILSTTTTTTTAYYLLCYQLLSTYRFYYCLHAIVSC